MRSLTIIIPYFDNLQLHAMLVLLDREWGVEADPPDKNFQSPVWGHLQPLGGV